MYVPADDGSWINENTARIAELIEEYDHRLELRWIRPDQRKPGEPEFAVIEKADDGREYVAFLIQDESFVNHNLLARIYAADNKDKNVDDITLEMNKAVRALQKKQEEDRMAEAADLAHSMFKSPFHTYRHNGRKINL